MLQSLNALAGKISPGSPPSMDTNANKIHVQNNNNNNNNDNNNKNNYNNNNTPCNKNKNYLNNNNNSNNNNNNNSTPNNNNNNNSLLNNNNNNNEDNNSSNNNNNNNCSNNNKCNIKLDNVISGIKTSTVNNHIKNDNNNNNSISKNNNSCTNISNNVFHHPHPYSKHQSSIQHHQSSRTQQHQQQQINDCDNDDIIIGDIGSLAGDKPDPDTIKMFVGQVPHDMEENDLRTMFEEFGRVHQINVLRNKYTGTHQGCCFVTFYTRRAALAAQNALHNIKTFNGMHRPIQMKPADSGHRNDRKLFVGMLSKKYSENDVRNMFDVYGAIEECSVLRDNSTGQSRGCAFVTFATKQHAINAIKALHHSRTMEGCSSPLVVKFADTQKEKDQKRLQQYQANLWNIAGTVGMPAPHYLTNNDTHALASAQLLQQLQTTLTPGVGPSAVACPTGASNPAAMSTVQHQLLIQQHLGLNGAAAVTPQGVASLPEMTQSHLQGLATLATLGGANTGEYIGANPVGVTSPMSMQDLMALASMTNAANIQVPSGTLGGLVNSQGSLTQWPTATQVTNNGTAVSNANGFSPVSLTLNSLAGTASLSAGANGAGTLQDTLSSAYSSLQQYAALIGKTVTTSTSTSSSVQENKKGLKHRFSTLPTTGQTGTTTGNSSVASAVAAAALAAQQQAMIINAAGKQIEGPEGCNLFIYHLPQDFTDFDLASTFVPFGNMLSAKVVVDLKTNTSRCFGFVSYDNPASAAAAIQTMNGFHIGAKRLKVEHKRAKEAAKPY
ncbi:CUGBP Elav-like family member 2 isoform X2 [Microplitis mediator]|uniref:CUGBP Elav-like family member 2 isoform X2 n=1 Tax=Microplitis mediator TaxID=375433 RepID=UPI0025536979|nr:CUGBP Elav-like family member 2 isoform X2 [Microplitis mediator]